MSEEVVKGAPLTENTSMVKYESLVAENAALKMQLARPPEKILNQTDYLAMSESFGNIATTKEQQDLLFAPVDENDVEIRADGLVYLPWMGYVKRLKDAFGTSWGLLPQGAPRVKDGFVMWGFYLCIQGKMAAYAIGESEQTSRMTYGDCIEAAKSNALMRLCKGLGISLELWNPGFVRGWKEKFAIQDLPVTDSRGAPVMVNGKPKMLWRRKDSTEISEVREILASREGTKTEVPPPPPPVRQEVATPPPPPPVRQEAVTSPPPPVQEEKKKEDPHDQPVAGGVSGTVFVKIIGVNVHKPGANSRAKNPSYRISGADNKMYYTFDKSLAIIAKEASKSGVSVKIGYEVTAYGLKVGSLISGPFDSELPGVLK